MFYGRWLNFTPLQIINTIKPSINELGTFITSIFGDNTFSTLGDNLIGQIIIDGQPYYGWMVMSAFVLSLITSIGIVVMAVKGIKRVFGVFFMGIR